MTMRGRTGVALAIAAVIVVVVVVRERGRPRVDALRRPPPHTIHPITHPTAASGGETDPFAELRDLTDPEKAAGRAAWDAQAGGPESVSDVVGFWSGFGDRLLAAGVLSPYVEALRATYGTTEPRTFVTLDPAAVAASMMTYLNTTHEEDGVFLVTDREAAAFQQIARELLAAAR